MKRKYGFIVTIFVIIIAQNAAAQLNPLSAQYYTNEYLGNPAQAGKQKGLIINGAYRKFWSSIPGMPVTQNITADYGFNRVGLGININNETAGLIRQTRTMGTYAYHLPLDSGRRQLHFGISFGFMNQGLENSRISGDPNDNSVGEFNSRRTYFDSDFGIAYTSNRISLQLAIPNLKQFFDRDLINIANMATFYGALSYKVILGEEIHIEPKVAMRGVKHNKDMFDIGTQLSFKDQRLQGMAMYHSNKSATFGFGLNILSKYMVFGTYTMQTAAMNSYVNGSFEINLKASL